jgi:hypothetical protein
MDETTRRKTEMGKRVLRLEALLARAAEVEMEEKRRRKRAPMAEAKIIPFRRRREESRPDPAA